MAEKYINYQKTLLPKSAETRDSLFTSILGAERPDYYGFFLFTMYELHLEFLEGFSQNKQHFCCISGLSKFELVDKYWFFI